MDIGEQERKTAYWALWSSLLGFRSGMDAYCIKHVVGCCGRYLTHGTEKGKGMPSGDTSLRSIDIQNIRHRVGVRPDTSEEENIRRASYGSSCRLGKASDVLPVMGLMCLVTGLRGATGGIFCG